MNKLYIHTFGIRVHKELYIIVYTYIISFLAFTCDDLSHKSYGELCISFYGFGAPYHTNGYYP